MLEIITKHKSGSLRLSEKDIIELKSYIENSKDKNRRYLNLLLVQNQILNNSDQINCKICPFTDECIFKTKTFDCQVVMVNKGNPLNRGEYEC